MNLKHNLLIALSLFVCVHASAQQTHEILFKSGTFTPSLQSEFRHDYTTDELSNGYYYRLIQFDQIPTSAGKAELHLAGIELLNYMPRNAFFARISSSADLSVLQQRGCVSSLPIRPEYKLSADLFSGNYPHWALFGTDQIELNAVYFEGVHSSDAIASLETAGAILLHESSARFLEVRVPLSRLNDLFTLPDFYYFEAVSAPEEPENLDGRTDHRSNVLFTEYAGGLQYDGTGVTVMMQDDGYIGDHIDYEGRIDQSGCNGCTWLDANNHGDHVAGTIMGAGNLNPRYRGMASGAHLLVYNSSNSNYDDVPTLYANEELVITSKSYSSGCNGGYDARAMQLDQQCHDLSGLIHVFSAGNSGTSDCGYGAGAGWGNITGGHKSGKNVIAVGNLTALDALNSSSSRGPATDGRIKPDICAVGTSVISTISDYTYESKTGTSMACPGVAGTVTQLYQAYRDLNGGNNPPGGLIKAAVLNTAEDLGNPGPDFQYGWGRINAIRAYDVMEQGTYMLGSASQGVTNTHILNVPGGVTKLKVMVYWTDYEGTVNATTALVNDLNFRVTDPGMVTWSPWVLDPTPNAVTLDTDAIPGNDNLNNMEQVTIDSPLPGSYTLTVEGFSVPEGPQEYYIVYSFERDEIRVTYPIGGEGLVPAASERIRWDATGGSGDFTVDYTLDNGSNWISLTTVGQDERSVAWSVPNTLSGQVRIRVSRGAQSDESDANFSIIGVPGNLNFGWACPDSLNITWNAVPGATSYEVYMLGSMYMDPVGTTTATNLTVPASAQDENWFSVRAFGPNGARGERAVAVRKVPGEFGCTWSTPYAGVSVNCDSISSLNCVQVMNASVNDGNNASYLWYFPTGIPSTSTDENPVVCFNSSGYHDAALVVTNNYGSDSAYFTDFVFAQTAVTLPYFEGFENISTLNGQENWSVYNPDANNTFAITTTAALTGSRSVRLSNHSENPGSIDELISGPVDLTILDPASDIMTISFRYAYKKRDANSDDWLRFYVKEACDGVWSLKKTLHGNFLSTLTSNAPWTPQGPEDWTTVHVTNISPTYFTGDFRFKFNFENGEGNNFFLDDINIYSGAPSDDIISGLEENATGLSTGIFPNPTDEELNVRFALNSASPVSLEIRDLSGKLVFTRYLSGTQGDNLAVIGTRELQAGMYFLSIGIGGNQQVHTFVVK